MNAYVEITNDVLDIVWEIKKIDNDYSIRYNKSAHRYELHHTACKPTMQLVIPYSSLDMRTVYLVRKTLLRNALDELMDIDNYNDKLADKMHNISLDRLNYKAKQLIDYYRKGGEQYVSYDNI